MSERSWLDRALDGDYTGAYGQLEALEHFIDYRLPTGLEDVELNMVGDAFHAYRHHVVRYIVERRREERRLKAEVERLTERLAAIGAWMEESGVGWDPMRKKVTKTPRRAP